MPNAPKIDGKMLMMKMDLTTPNFVYVDGRGGKAGGYEEGDMHSLLYSIKSTINQNQISRSQIEGSGEALGFEARFQGRVIFKNFILADSKAAAADGTIAVTDTTGKSVMNIDFVVAAYASDKANSSRDIKTNIHKAIAYQMITGLTAAAAGKPVQRVQEYGGATFVASMEEALKPFPTIMVTTICTSTYQGQCTQYSTYTFKDIKWMKFVKDGAKGAPKGKK